jgi:hypothetical protein
LPDFIMVKTIEWPSDADTDAGLFGANNAPLVSLLKQDCKDASERHHGAHRVGADVYVAVPEQHIDHPSVLRRMFRLL